MLRFDRFALATLAVDRLTQLVTDDEITRPLREAVSSRWPDSKLEYLVGCQACVSVWAALLVSSGLVPRKVSLALALSGAVLHVGKAEDRIGALVASYARKTRGAVGGTVPGDSS